MEVRLGVLCILAAPSRVLGRIFIGGGIKRMVLYEVGT